MALQKQSVPVIFAQGLDTKTDPKQVIRGKLLRLENGVFISPLRIRKRYGYNKLGQAGLLGAGCATYQDELLSFDGNAVRSYAKSLGTFQSKGSFSSVEVKNQSVLSNDYAQSSQDSCFHTFGLKVFVWEDGRGGSRYSVFDSNTSQQIVSDAVLDSSGQTPKVFALGNYVLFVYFDGTNLVYKKFSVNAPTTLSSKVSIVGTIVVAKPRFDGVVIGSRLFLAWNDTTGGTAVSVCYITSNLVVSAQTNIAANNADISITAWGDLNQNLWIAFYNGTKVRGAVFDYNVVAVVAVYDIETVSNVLRLTGIETSNTSPTLNVSTVFYEISATNNYDHNVRFVTLSRNATAVTPGTPAVFLRSVGLSTKCFGYNGAYYVGLIYDSGLQPSYFIANTSKNLVAKIAFQTSGGLGAKNILPQVSIIGTADFLVALLEKTSLDVQSGTLFSLNGVIGATLSFASNNIFLRAQMANNLHITGGFLSMYDGVSVVEHGFHIFPEASGLTSALTGGGIGAGTYQWVTLYEWTDNHGNIHRSAPSIAQSATIPVGTGVTPTVTTAIGSTTLTAISSLTGLVVGQHITGTGIPANTYIQSIGAVNTLVMTNAATANGTVTMTTLDTNKMTLAVPTLRLTAKQTAFNRTNVTLSVYRNQNAGTVFYKVSSLSSPTFNDPTADTVNFIDTVPDFYLNGNELLYTTGGVLENIPPPAVSLISTFKGRIVVVPSENKQTFFVSKKWVPGSPVEFSDAFRKTIDARDGDITAIAEMDEKEIIFKLNTAWLTAGNGPNDSGTQDDLVEPELITTAEGCTNPRSVVVTPVGLMRQTTKGIYLLDRSLQDSYIGAPVEAYNNLAITSAQVIPNTNQVRFTTSSGTCLVYDWLFQQWSVFTNHNVVDSAVFQNLFTYLDGSGNAFQETIGEYLDDAAFIKLKILTSWLSFAGLQGFQRVWQMLLLGDYMSPHRMIVTAAYDFNPNPTQQTYIDAGTLLENGAYGDSSPYGADSVYGGDFPLYQFRVFMLKQKCQAIQIGLEEVQDSNFGEGLSLSALLFNVGVKGGAFKVAPTRSFS